MIDNEAVTKILTDIDESPSSLDTLLEFEGVLDNLNIYAYANWQHGEIVAGPEITRYWVEVTLMYPEKLMPDPEGALRLTRHGCHVFFQKDKYVTSVEVKTPDDLEMDDEGKRKPKKITNKIWLVKISVPRDAIDEFNTSTIEINGVDIDMSEVTQAYDEDLDVDENKESIPDDGDEDQLEGDF